MNGPGPLPAAPLGILNDAAVPAVAFNTDVPQTILDGLTAVSAAGYGTGAVALNPDDWADVQALKDTTGRSLYSGSPFQGPGRSR